MEEEVYQTTIGLFKIKDHPKNGKLVYVETCVPTNEAEIWEEMGCMKRKEFLDMINAYDPKKYKVI